MVISFQFQLYFKITIAFSGENPTGDPTGDEKQNGHSTEYN